MLLNDWFIVWTAFCGGLAVALCLAARQARRRAALWLALAALLVTGVGAGSFWQAVAATSEAASPRVDFDSSPEQEAAARGSLTEALISLPDPGPTEIPPIVARRLSNSVQPAEAEGELGQSVARLRIPSLGLDRPIVTVGFHNSLWDLNSIGDQVGWLQTTGDRPGAGLAMVLVGHVTLQNLQLGAFGNLEGIQKGAEVIYQIGGGDYVYVVREKGRVPPEAVDSLYVENGRSLILITCTDWDGSAWAYANRLRVRADLVEQGVADEEP